ncbi:MAG: MBL fold metallo-hydrolase [Ruminococcaceae bacterium]|nr:MBL fold metallo-hydrolase [Oscillospiraceae bacterium]
MKRCLALLSALLLSALLLTTFAGSFAFAAEPTQTESRQTVTQTELKDMAIVSGGVANYTVVRSENASSRTVTTVAQLIKRIENYTGTRPKQATDWHKEGTALDSDALEILVGHTAHPESAEALKGVGYGDYVVKQVGRKLVINAWSDAALEKALTSLYSVIKKQAVYGELILSGDLLITGTVAPIANQLPFYPHGNTTFVADTGIENYLVLVENTDVEAYDAYAELLGKEGYTLYTAREVNGNKFATYTNKKYAIHANYIAYSHEVRLIIEKETVLPALEEEKTAKAAAAPRFAMLGLEYEYNDVLLQNGMSFIWQIPDGSFIIMDGGVTRHRDSKALYDFMYAYAPDKNNITVSAWIITHAHVDHHGTFVNFCQGPYISKVKIKQVIANLGNAETMEVTGSISGGNSQALIDVIEKHAENGYVKAHTGQIFHFGDASVDILYTYESILPKQITGSNTYSLICAVEVGGQRFLMPGDATNDALTVAYKMYGKTLESDFLQITHHGADLASNKHNGAAQVYNLSKAPVVLWPAGQGAYEAYRSYARNVLATHKKTTKEIFVAGSRNVILHLPYTPGTSGQESILK